MKIKVAVMFMVMLMCSAATAVAQAPKLEGAYKWVSTKFPGGSQTEAQAKGMIVVHGKYMAFVRAGVDRKTWEQSEPEADRTKKIIAAYQGLAATAGDFTIEGNVITLNQVAQANPGTMGKQAKWEYRLDGNKLMLKPVGNADVEFTFERLP